MIDFTKLHEVLRTALPSYVTSDDPQFCGHNPAQLLRLVADRIDDDIPEAGVEISPGRVDEALMTDHRFTDEERQLLTVFVMEKLVAIRSDAEMSRNVKELEAILCTRHQRSKEVPNAI